MGNKSYGIRYPQYLNVVEHFDDEYMFPSPPAHGHVLDTAGIISQRGIDKMNKTCKKVLADTGVPIIVAVLDTLGLTEEQDAVWIEELQQQATHTRHNLDQKLSFDVFKLRKGEQDVVQSENVWTAHVMSDRVKHYTTLLFNEWGVGGGSTQPDVEAWHNGILLVCWKHKENFVFDIRLGKDWSDAVGSCTMIDNALRKVIHVDINKRFQETEELEKSLHAGVKGLRDLALSHEALEGVVMEAPDLANRPRTRFQQGVALACRCSHCYRARQEWKAHPPPGVQGRYYQFVNDHANIIRGSHRVQIEEMARVLWAKKRVPVVFLTIQKLMNVNPLRYARTVFEDWGVGLAEWNYGILVFSSADDKELRVVRGRGWFKTDLGKEEDLGDLEESLQGYDPDLLTGGYAQPFLSKMKMLANQAETFLADPPAEVASSSACPYATGSCKK